MPFDSYNGDISLDRIYNFYPEGLLSKWGFADGDLLDYAFTREDLCDFVEKVIVPQITSHKVETCRISTIHNPIRAKTVDGIEVEYPQDERFVLLPEVISYTGHEIQALLLECHNKSNT